MHSPQSALRAFIAFEEREQLFERQLLGVAYWQLIRHDVFRATLEALGLAARAHQRLEELPLSHWLGSQLRQLPRTVPRSFFTRLPRAELLVATHPRHLRYRGQFICPYAQPLLWGTDVPRVQLTGHYQGRYFMPDAGEPTRYVDLGLVLSHAAFRVRELLGRGLPDHEIRALGALADALRLQLGAAPPAAVLVRRARTAVLSSLGLRPWLEQLIERVSPRLVVDVVGYRLVNQLLTLCAREHRIPVAELQHGTIGAAHAGYNFAPARKPPAFPDHLLSFGEIWRELTPGLPLSAEAVHPVGYGWLALQASAHVKTPPSRARRVLFISQGDIGRELAALAVTLRAELSAERFELVYRLHPSEAPGWERSYPELARSGIRVELPMARELYAAQADADVQVGVYSTALLEGLAFGLDTCLVALPGHEQLLFLQERGLARLAHDAGELRTLLNDPRPASPQASAALWAPSPPARFAAFVAQQLG
ncbi:MAG: hypothetical protein ABW321_18450 [Polyangiales bacterium]